MTKLRKIVASVSMLAMMVGVVPQVSAAGPFGDVAETNEFATFIQDLKDQGIVSGVGDTGMYFPLRNVSRGEMMKMVVNAMQKSVQGRGSLEVLVNVPMLPGAPHFSDVPAGSSFYNQVELGYALGIVQGRQAPASGQAGVFGVDAPVLRQEAMKMIVRAYRIFAPETFVQDLTGGPSFDDVSTSSEFYDYIQTAYNLGVIKGYGNSKFGPMDPMRRDQMAKVVSNSMKVFREGKPLSVGVPAAVQVDNSDPQIKNDGTSTSTITCTVVDRNGNRIGDWNQPLVFSTDAGTLRIVGTSEAAANTKTVSSDKGRGQITLISSTTAGTATVKCKTGSYEGTTRVEFTSSAPGIRNGFGSARIAGVGELNVRITDDAIVAKREGRPTGANSSDAATPVYSGSNAVVAPINGFATIEAFVYDDEGDPTCGDDLIFSIKEGNGSLVAGSAATGTSEPTAPASTAVRSLTLDDGDCVNGRYVAYLNVLTTQNSGDVVIQVLDRSTSPSLVTTATVSIDLVRLEAKAFDTNILTRNDGQIAAGEATSQNVAPVLIKTLDENDEPFLALEDTGDVDEIECRFIGGPVTDAMLEGIDTDSEATGAADVNPNVVMARYVPGSAGLYVLNVIAGSNGGTLQVECRDIDSIGQPAVRVNISVREPEVELFVSSDSMPEGTVSTVLARVTDGNKPVYGEQLRLTIDGGDSQLDDVDGSGYVRSEGQDSVFMDKICYNNASASTASESRLNAGASTSSSFATVEIVPFGTDCDSNYTESGWYTAKLFAPENVERDQTESIRVTDISRGSQPPEDSISVVSTTDNPSDLATIEVLPLRQEVGINQDIPTVVFAQDQDNIGLACTDTGTGTTVTANGETASATQSGCIEEINGYAVDVSDSITMNSDEVNPDTLGAIVVNPDNVENVRLYSRGTGTLDTDDFWVLHNLGGGAYFMVARAKDRADRGEWRVESYDSDGTPQDSGLVQVNIVPNDIEVEFNLPDTIPDWNNTFIAFVSDENDDPVAGLESCRGGTGVATATYPTNNFSDFVITRGGVAAQDIAAVTDGSTSIQTGDCSTGDDATDLLNSGVVGSGIYAFNVDTNNLVTDGTLTLTASLNQATNPQDSASYGVEDPTVELTAWPFSVTSSNIVPFTVIVRDDDGDPLDVDNNTTDGVQVEIVDGSGNLATSNTTSVSGGLRVTLVDSDDGVSVGAFRASSVSESVELTARVNTLSSRIEDTMTIAVD